MGVLSNISALFGLDDEIWMRHANPWSVWTRFAILPFLLAALWSYSWIGLYCLIPIGILVIWTWYNPRAFGKPKSTRNWASRAVLGERVWLRRSETAVPAHHNGVIKGLQAVMGFGLLITVYGLIAQNWWAALLGLCLVVLGKMWFLDRMVWIYLDMKDVSEEYRSWDY